MWGQLHAREAFPCSFHCLCFFADQVFVTYHQFCVVSFASWSDVCSLPVLPAPWCGAATIAGRRPSHQHSSSTPMGIHGPGGSSTTKTGYGRGLAGHLSEHVNFSQTGCQSIGMKWNEEIYRVWSELQYAGIPGYEDEFITWRLCGLCPWYSKLGAAYSLEPWNSRWKAGTNMINKNQTP